MDLFSEDIHLILDSVQLLRHPGLQSHLVLDNTMITWLVANTNYAMELFRSCSINAHT